MKHVYIHIWKLTLGTCYHFFLLHTHLHDYLNLCLYTIHFGVLTDNLLIISNCSLSNFKLISQKCLLLQSVFSVNIMMGTLIDREGSRVMCQKSGLVDVCSCILCKLGKRMRLDIYVKTSKYFNLTTHEWLLRNILENIIPLKASQNSYFIHYLHDVTCINTYKVVMCLSVCFTRYKNVDKIWYEYYTTGSHPMLSICSFIEPVITVWQRH
jgi:hypothetical protein